MFDAISAPMLASGLSVNISKTSILSWLSDGQNKKRIFNSLHASKIREHRVSVMEVDENFVYLGVNFTPGGRSPVVPQIYIC